MKLEVRVWVLISLFLFPSLCLGQDKKAQKEAVKKVVLRGAIEYWSPPIKMGAVKAENGRLSGVTVTIKSLFQYPESGEVTVLKDGFLPKSVVIKEGSPVVFHNKRAVYCKLRALSKRGEIDFFESLPPSSKMRKIFKKEATVKVQCVFHKNEWCWIYVSKNKSYSAKTNKNGAFEIKGAKPGPYQLTFMHSLVNFKKEVFTVRAKDTELRTDKRLRLNLKHGITSLSLKPVGLMKPKPGCVSGYLRGVKTGFVYAYRVKGSHSFKKEERVQVIDFKKSEKDPRAVVVAVGGKVVVRNSSGTLMVVKANHPILKTPLNEALRKGEEEEIKTSRSGLFRLYYEKLGLVNKRGEVWVLVAKNPYYAVINEAGCFALPKLPKGKYKLKFWDPEHKMPRSLNFNDKVMRLSPAGVKYRQEGDETVFVTGGR